MIVSIMQPCYLPWLGFFDRAMRSDLLILLDHVEIGKNTAENFANRNRLRIKQGSCWITVPIRTKGRFGSLHLETIEIAENVPWAKKHWKTMQTHYGKTAFFDDHASFFQKVYQQNWSRLADVVRVTTDYLFDVLDIRTERVYSSQMDASGHKGELVLNLCHEVGADKYLSGPFGRKYLDVNSFNRAEVDVVFHDYDHPEYSQAYPGFVSHLSVVDLLLNHGPRSREILASEGGETQS
jgi:hypothetical protein